jgi:hypothetical protein
LESDLTKVTPQETDVHRVVRSVKTMRRHAAADFRFAGEDFLGKLEALVSELDYDAEFVSLEKLGRSYLLKIRHR